MVSAIAVATASRELAGAVKSTRTVYMIIRVSPGLKPDLKGRLALEGLDVSCISWETTTEQEGRVGGKSSCSENAPGYCTTLMP